MSDLALAAAYRDRLKRWLLTEAAPLWARVGVDAVSGAFVEKIDDDFTPTPSPRRARVQPRQVYAFAEAAALGWGAPWREIVQRGLAAFETRYHRPDGLYRALVSEAGEPLEETARLYDQAFALFGLAAAYRVLPEDVRLPNRALTLLGVIQTRFGRGGAGLASALDAPEPLLSNPHMHMLEACLAWYDLTQANPWLEQTDAIAKLALTRFISRETGALLETFDAHWAPAPGLLGRIVEPGHQFEWAWLLMRWGDLRHSSAAIAAGRRLLEIGERHGCDPVRGVSMNALLDDFTLHDGAARLWPQTERIKAGALAAALGDDTGWEVACRGAAGLIGYLEAAPSGLWRDSMTADGDYVVEPAPASSFYHIVCAIAELDRHVGAGLSAGTEKASGGIGLSLSAALN
jgi:mannose/cellobiose epimerase-like protein (N-acyl-D-glucosamine 2-epimerase family)